MAHHNTRYDLLPEISSIVRDAIKDQLINSETLMNFDLQVKSLENSELEEYLQNLWDDI